MLAFRSNLGNKGGFQLLDLIMYDMPCYTLQIYTFFLHWKGNEIYRLPPLMLCMHQLNYV